MTFALLLLAFALPFACYVAGYRHGRSYVLTPHSSPRPERTPIDTGAWFIQPEADELRILRRVARVHTNNPEYDKFEVAGVYPYDASDPESYGAALARAERHLDGLRAVAERARELSEG